jgi:mono/diheme cytochrome c family protein
MSIRRLLVLLGLLSVGIPLLAQLRVQPGSADRGSALFRNKGCVQCHAYNGVGGSGAPDLAQFPRGNKAPAALAAAMWNHAPVMWDAMPIAGVRTPEMTSAEAADLLAHFYSLLHFIEPGNAGRGRSVYEQKGCAGCHNDEPGIGPALSDWRNAENPFEWPERMWNHSGLMADEISRSRLSWPELTAQEVTDLIFYIQSLKAGGAQPPAPPPGDPERGKVTFERSCVDCHSFGPDRQRVDLAGRPAPRAFVEYIAGMWNHVPQMARRAGGVLPRLERGEMADLGAYLFARRYFDEQGDAGAGERVFAANCEACHGARREEFKAPDLAAAVERFSPVTMTSALWRHDRAIREIAGRRGISWPHFEGSEISDLIAFLNSRIVPRIGRR